MLAERKKQPVPESVGKLGDLQDKIKEKFEGVTEDQPLFIALDDFIKETELTALKKDLEEDPQKFINESGKEAYGEKVEKVNNALTELKEEISEKEENIDGYGKSRSDVGSIFRDLTDLTAIVLEEENGEDAEDAKKKAFNSTLSFYRSIRAEVLEGSVN